MPFIESTDEFILRQKCPSIMVGDRRIFENGSVIRFGSGTDPPKDAAELRMLAYEFQRATLTRMIQEFRSARTNISTQNYFHSLGAGPPAAEGGVEFLKEFAERIEKKQVLVTKLHTALPHVTKAGKNDAYRDQQRKAAQAMATGLAEVPTI